MRIRNISIIGDGGWGTALAIVLSKRAYVVKLWSPFKDYASVIERTRKNPKFLPGIDIPKKIEIFSDIRQAEDSDLLIIAVPSVYLRQVLKRLKNINLKNKVIVSAIKGIESNTLKRMSEIIIDELQIPENRFGVISGPTIAHEVAKGMPTTAVTASKNKVLAAKLQDIFMTDTFRVYSSDDVIGVELGGSLKNVIAIACGISDGLGFGSNAKAALLARGLAEITRLGLFLKAKDKTFSGISGLGDLVTTCISEYSRNRFVGEELAKGKKINDVVKKMEMVAEGVYCVKSVYQMSKKYKIDMPVTKEIYNVIYNNKSPTKAVIDLMSRRKKSEI